MVSDFEERLRDLIASYQGVGTPLDEIISAVELTLYGLHEEEAGQRE